MDIPLPQVISGVKPDQLLHAILTLLGLIKNREIRVVNDYPEVVFPDGNPIAKRMIRETLKPVDAEWRGMCVIPLSGLAPIYERLDSPLIYADLFTDTVSVENP